MKENLDSNLLVDKNRISLILLVGAPASGKSTWGKAFSQKVGAKYISTDAIRAEIGKGESDQTVSPTAFAIATQRIQRALSSGRHVVFDATNINRNSRKRFIDMGRDHDAYVVAVVFEVDRAELLRRDAQRERHVGEEVIDNFLHKYQRPTEDEVDKVVVKH